MSISIPNLHVTSKGAVKGKAVIFIQQRKDATHPGTFDLAIDAHFDPATDEYPVLSTLVLRTQLTDTMFNPPAVTFTATTIELTNSYGKDTPTIYLTGRCKSSYERHRGCKYWILIANNKGREAPTQDVVGFAIIDRNGDRVAYATGSAQQSSLDVLAPGI